MSKRIHKYNVPRDVVEATRVSFDGNVYRPIAAGSRVAASPEPGVAAGVAAPWTVRDETVELRLTPGAHNYAESFDDPDPRLLVAAALLTAVVGHPDAEDDRAGTALAAVWSHHLALARGDDPRRVAKIYAPTETKSIAWRVQHAAALGIEISAEPS